MHSHKKKDKSLRSNRLNCPVENRGQNTMQNESIEKWQPRIITETTNANKRVAFSTSNRFNMPLLLRCFCASPFDTRYYASNHFLLSMHKSTFAFCCRDNPHQSYGINRTTRHRGKIETTNMKRVHVEFLFVRPHFSVDFFASLAPNTICS